MKQSTHREYQRRICLAMDYIHAHLEENPPLEEIARAASFSKFHFHRLFRAFVGETVAAFQRRLRLEKAAGMLFYDHHIDITSVALACGFQSSQSFAKAFKKHFDASPSEFRHHYAIKPPDDAALLQNSKIGHIKSKPGHADWDAAAYLEAQTNHASRRQSMQVIVQELPPKRLAYIRHIGDYQAATIEDTFTTLLTWASARGLLDAQEVLGLIWDDPTITPKEHCRFDVAVTLPDDLQPDDLSTQSLAAGTYATYRQVLSLKEVEETWEQLFSTWLPQSGYQPTDGPCFEQYHNDPDAHPEGKWDVEFHIPLLPL